MNERSEASAAFWAALPLGPDVTVLAYDANGLGALAKPAGVRSHPNEDVVGIDRHALLAADYAPDAEHFEWTPPGAAVPARLWLLNRLDAATSGVILAAADAALAASIRELFQRKRVRKVYQALVFGAPARPVELWRDWLKIEKAGGHIRAGLGGGIMAETQMSVLSRSRGGASLSLLKLEPRTGRSHQLRVQCAERGLPIVGDMTYGDFSANREFFRAGGTKRMFLHSAETAFDYEWQGRTHRFVAKAPPPPDFRASG
ncbi:MAG: RNA pseudouridine synthase [Verrucomicrobiota bacterium]